MKPWNSVSMSQVLTTNKLPSWLWEECRGRQREHPHLEDAQFRRGGDKKNRPQGGGTCWLISTVNLKPGVIERLASGPASGGLSRIR